MNRTIKTDVYAKDFPALAARKAGRFTAARTGTESDSLHSEKSGRWPFIFLLAFTVVLYGRPGDYIELLRKIQLAEFTAVAAVGSYVLARLRGGLPFVFPWQTKLMAVLTFLFAASIPDAFWRFKAYQTFTDSWVKTVIIFFLLTQTVNTLPRIKMLLWAILLSMLLVSAFSLPHADKMIDRQGRYVGATMGFLSGNFLGIAVSSMFPFISVFLARTKSWLAMLTLFLTTAMLLWQIVLTASRGNFMQMAFSGLFCWFLILSKYRRTRLIALVLVASMAVFLAFAPRIFWGRMATLWGQTDETWMAESATQSENQRKNLFWRAVEYTLEDPLVGIGLGCFSDKSGTTEMRASEWLGTHNTFLQISSEAGIPALIVFVFILGSSILSMRRIVLRCSKHKELEDLSLLAKGALASLATFAFAGFFAHLAYEFYIYYLIGISVAVETVYRNDQTQALLDAGKAGSHATSPRPLSGSGRLSRAPISRKMVF